MSAYVFRLFLPGDRLGFIVAAFPFEVKYLRQGNFIMKIRKKFIAELSLAFVLFVFIITPLSAQETQKEKKAPKISFIQGPKKVKMDDVAEIMVPKGYIFANGDDTRKVMKLYENFITNQEVGYLAPKSHKWFLIFEFDEVGYVKDDEKNELDADKMLKDLQEASEEGNKRRKLQGLPIHTLKGWFKKPDYNPATNNLEWATIFTVDGKDTINYNIRYLGRKGVMEVIVVGDPATFQETIGKANDLLTRYSFAKGNKYSEYVQGDKIAEYGLTALVTGGAFAAAAKSGLLSKIWKFLVVGILAVGAFAKKIFAKIIGKDKEISDGNDENKDRV